MIFKSSSTYAFDVTHVGIPSQYPGLCTRSFGRRSSDGPYPIAGGYQLDCGYLTYPHPPRPFTQTYLEVIGSHGGHGVVLECLLRCLFLPFTLHLPLCEIKLMNWTGNYPFRLSKYTRP
jgi:hypothetical protein